MVGIYYGTEKVEREDPNEDPYESIRAVKPSGEWVDWARADASLIADAPLLLQEVKRLRKENEYLRESDWEYSCLWTWLHENTDLPKTIEPILLSKWKSEWVKKSKEADE